MIQKRSVKFGMIGAGAIGQAYSQAFTKTDQAELVSVADVRAEAVQAIADTIGCASFESADEMFEKSMLDAVLVCPPP